ncbi:MAG: hypothetical protein ACT4O1_12285, partial [Gemmatimonadota bacterium]
MNRLRHVVLLPLFALLVTGCADREPLEPGARQSAAMENVSQDPTPDPAAVAAVVPGFGGYFLDESGAPTVYLTDATQRAAAEDALAGFLADRGFSASDLRVRQGSYDYLQLDAWHAGSWAQALAVSGAIFTDLDEGSNQLRFGAVDAASAANVAAAVAAAGVPTEAFTVEVTAPIEPLHTLRDRVRPVQGGYQINFLDAGGVRTVSFLCTMGFNVVKNGVNSFITNSHCTNHQGGTEIPTEYYQPLMDPDGDRLVNPENFIGTEVEDPHYDAVSCAMDFLPGTVCRYSDAARAEYAGDQPFDLGRIARTTVGYQDLPEGGAVLDVDPNDPAFRIVQESKRSVLGEVANKVGRTTGWSFGPITQTCLNSIVLGTVPPIVQRCQDRVRATVDSGDSGSPVFRQLGNGGNVRLLGILWGGSVSGVRTFVFSPMANIHRE